MCGRYASYTTDEEREILEIVQAVINANLQAKSDPASRPGPVEVFPTNSVPVLLGDEYELRAVLMGWGYPGYPDRRYPNRRPRPLINTRSETAAKLPTWRESLARRRCIVPSGGFFEWQHGGPGDKTKYRFNVPDSPALFMAGIWQNFPAPDGSLVPQFSILTTAANGWIADVHDRMPVVLRRDEWAAWLLDNDHRIFDRSDLELIRCIAA
ncbi:MAG: SOS response-associated peptidase [Bacillota bacterium]|nr:SOS response-associated peptidase [Bacillota bacterium]